MPSNRKSKTVTSDRIIFLTGEISDDSVSVIAKQLFTLDDPDRDILLVLNSCGGSIDAALFLTNIFKLLRSDIAVLAPGAAQSAATFILVCGTPGKRLAMPGASAMMHGSTYEMPEGPHLVQKSYVDYQHRTDKLLSEIMTNKGVKNSKSGLASEYHFYVGEEIVDAGMADYIVNSLADLNKYVKM